MNTRLEEQLHTISGLSNAFFAVYWVDLRSILKSIPFFQQAVQDCRTTNGITQAFITLCVQPEDQEKMRVFMDRQRLGALLEKNDLTVDEFHGTLEVQEWCRTSRIAVSRNGDVRVSSALFSVKDISAGVTKQWQLEREPQLLGEWTYGISSLFLTVWLISQDDRYGVKYRDTRRESVAREPIFSAKTLLNYTVGMRNYLTRLRLRRRLGEICPKGPI